MTVTIVPSAKVAFDGSRLELPPKHSPRAPWDVTETNIKATITSFCNLMGFPVANRETTIANDEIDFRMAYFPVMECASSEQVPVVWTVFPL